MKSIKASACFHSKLLFVYYLFIHNEAEWIRYHTSECMEKKQLHVHLSGHVPFTVAIMELSPKHVCEAEEKIRTTESLDSSRRNRLHAITQQLEGKLSLLKEMDKDILDCCELEAIETEI